MEAILAKALDLALPEIFVCDLDVDRETCALLHEDAPFLWILGRQGTRMVVPDLRRSGWESDRIVQRAVNLVDCRYFWWDGETLSEISDEEEACLLLSMHEADLRCLARQYVRVA